MEVDEDDDCVIKEIPVYLCKDLVNQLYLFQFPCRSADSSHCAKNVVSSRVKPESGIIELDCSLDLESQYYNKKHERKDKAVFSSPINSDNEDEPDCPGKMINQLTLRSQRSILKKDINCYSVACLYDGKFCISALHDSLSFLPTYEHKEKENIKKSATKDYGSGDSSSSDNETEETPAVQVTVKFSQKNTEKAKISQELSHQQYLAKATEEPWCETTYYNTNSSTAAAALKGLTKTVPKNRTAMISLTEDQYLDVLVPRPDTSEMGEPPAK